MGSVLGIDFGSEYYKISMIRPGRPFTMVENLYS
jgi:hypoxia up-regulated 1